MGVRVVSDGVALRDGALDEVGTLIDVLSDHEERRLDAVAVEQLEQLGRPPLVRAVVVREGQELAPAGRPDDRLAEALRSGCERVVREEERRSGLHFGGE